MKKLILLLSVLLVFSSCSNSDDELTIEDNSNQENNEPFKKGVFILNEGTFGQNSASISFLSNDEELMNDVFTSNNGVPLGDTAQNIGFYEDKAFIVLNGSNEIKVVNRYTLKLITTLSTDLQNPRYIEFSQGKAFVTNWGDGGNPSDDFITVIELDDYTTRTIAVDEGPEEILAYEGSIYVAHKGGWGYGNSISEIDPNTEMVTQTLEVGDVPDAMTNYQGDIYVICSGKPAYSGSETAGSLYKINVNNNSTESILEWENNQHPQHLEQNNGNLYFTLNGSIYTTNTTNFEAPSQSLFTVSGQETNGIYGFALHKDKFYITEIVEYGSNAQFHIYNLNGILENSFNVGIQPNGFYFND